MTSSAGQYTLNPKKLGADNQYHKIEIPVGLPKAEKAAPAVGPYCAKQVNKMQMNSNC